MLCSKIRANGSYKKYVEVLWCQISMLYWSNH